MVHRKTDASDSAKQRDNFKLFNSKSSPVRNNCMGP